MSDKLRGNVWRSLRDIKATEEETGVPRRHARRPSDGWRTSVLRKAPLLDPLDPLGGPHVERRVTTGRPPPVGGAWPRPCSRMCLFADCWTLPPGAPPEMLISSLEIPEVKEVKEPSSHVKGNAPAASTLVSSPKRDHSSVQDRNGD